MGEQHRHMWEAPEMGLLVGTGPSIAAEGKEANASCLELRHMDENLVESWESR